LTPLLHSDGEEETMDKDLTTWLVLSASMLESSLFSERSESLGEDVTMGDAAFATIAAMNFLVSSAPRNFDLVSDKADSILLIPASPPTR
jgi:hypothetical protein